MQKWYDWLKDMKKKDEKEKMKEMHQQKVAQMINSAEGSAGLFAQNHEANTMEHRSWREEEDVRLLDRCETKRK